MPKLSDNDKLLHRIHSRAGKAMKDYGLIQDGDRILIGLSGGKDSLALVEVLASRARIFKPKFEVTAVHVSMSNVPYQADTDYLQRYCASWGVGFEHRVGSFDPDTDPQRGPCFLCAWNRRKILFEAARDLHCNKIALGHHQDDILETLLMNLCFQGAFSTMPPLLETDKLDVDIIRPLCLVREHELRAMAQIRQYPKQIKNCPYETVSNRHNIRAILQEMERLNPEAAASLWGAMTNIQTRYLPNKIQP
ncbi:MAG: tRNA 2-thiocytidine biosynthesis protein TtcA [Paludibacteraceae bacterium]|nr:tRNA 2-thiocytidine biosynthesis protein TtcA [Paludibacteraceae bacterium]